MAGANGILPKAPIHALNTQPDTQNITDPSHYDIHVAGQPCEVYDIQRCLLDRWELGAFSGHCLATAIKYIFRCGHKGGAAAAISDLGKALFYVGLALAELNHGALPIKLVERLKRMTPEFTPGVQPRAGDMFDPVPSAAPECKDGFCPMPTPIAVRGIDIAQVSPEKTQAILNRKW